MEREEFFKRLKLDDGAYFSYARIIAEQLFPIAVEIEEMIEDKILASKVASRMRSAQPLLARYLADLKIHQIQ
jgi:hypothetical protein